MTYQITLKTMEDVKNLNDMAFSYDGKIIVSNGLDYVDARSILFLFNLIGKPINLVFPDHEEPNKISKFLKKIDCLF